MTNDIERVGLSGSGRELINEANLCYLFRCVCVLAYLLMLLMAAELGECKRLLR